METIKRKLLLVDDDPSLLVTLGDFFRFEGYDVLCATSGEDAMVKMRPFQPDLIILDMGMPGMGGKGFLDRITNPNGSTLFPILVLTARSAMAEFFADKQIAGFIAKPCDPPDLLMEVTRILFAVAHDGSGSIKNQPARCIVVADSDPEQLQALEIEFLQLGFDVRTATTGAVALEKTIQAQPDALVTRLELKEMSADEVVSMLKRLPGTRDIKVVVYGLDLPETQLEHVVNLGIPESRMIKDLSVNTIVDRVMSVTGRA